MRDVIFMTDSLMNVIHLMKSIQKYDPLATKVCTKLTWKLNET